jgi:phospholipase C
LFGVKFENDEHPPTDIQRGQAYVAQVINAVRNGPFWKDSIIFITYDEHGGFYDHVAPPRTRQGHALRCTPKLRQFWSVTHTQFCG